MKTPFAERVARYVDFFEPNAYIPIHPKEYLELWDSKEGSKLLENLQAQYGLPILPLGVRVYE